MYPTQKSLITLALATATLGTAHALDISKADNTDALNLTTSWAGGSTPGSSDNAVWDATVTASRTAAMGADASWNGIKLSGAVGQQLVTNTNSTNLLTLGAGGIDFTGAATGSALLFQSQGLLTADQVWNVTNSFTTNTGGLAGLNQNEDLSFIAQALNISFDLGTRKITKTGAGTVVFSGGYNLTNGSIDLNQGTLVVQSGSSRNTASSVAINVASGTTLRYQVNSNSTPATALVQSGLVTLNGGTMNLVQNATTAGSTLNLTGGVFVNASSTITVSATITGSGAQNNPTLISGAVSGKGTLTLTNNTNVTTGTRPNITGAISDSGGVLGLNVTAGNFTLSGLNTYSGNTAVNGTGNLTLADNAGLTFVIGANGVNNGLSGNGTVGLDGDFTFNLAGAGTTLGDSWTIVNGTLTEVFGSTFTVNGFTDNGNNTWSLNNSGIVYGFDESTGVLSVTAVPEPSIALLGGLGLLGLLRRRR